MSIVLDGTTGLAGAATGALNGTLGATTPSTVAATTINASGVITGASFSGSASGLTGINTNLVTNGTFDSNTTGWSTGHASIASVAGGIDGNNCLQVTATDTSGTNWAQQAVTGFTVGKCYTVACSVKSGTSGNQTFALQIYNSGFSLLNAYVSGTSSSSWTTYAGSFIATGTTHYFLITKVSSTNSATMLFDSAMIY
jgi:hypothetical protein